MKKLIAISVVFVLLATAAFAEISVSGHVIGTVKTIEGNTESDDDVTAGASMGRVRLEAEGENDEGTFGAWVRAELGGSFAYDEKGYKKADEEDGKWSGNFEPTKEEDFYKYTNFYGHAWWKPIEAFKLTIGGNGGDGFFGADGNTRFNYYGEVGADVGIVAEDWAFDSAFFGGFNAKSGAGAILTIKPIGDALEVNIAVPFDSGFAKDQYNKTTVQVAYTAGFGKIALTYASNSGNTVKGKVKGTFPNLTGLDISGDGGKIYAYGGLKLSDNLELDIGVGYTLPVTEEIDFFGQGAADITYSAPLGVGVGVNFTSGQIGVKARVLGEFLGSAEVDQAGTNAYDLPLVVVFDVLPSYAINDNLTAFLDAGIKFTAEDKWDVATGTSFVFSDSLFGWHANPYIAYTVGSGAFYAGINVSSSGVKDSGLDWAVPIGLSVSF